MKTAFANARRDAKTDVTKRGKSAHVLQIVPADAMRMALNALAKRPASRARHVRPRPVNVDVQAIANTAAMRRGIVIPLAIIYFV